MTVTFHLSLEYNTMGIHRIQYEIHSYCDDCGRKQWYSSRDCVPSHSFTQAVFATNYADKFRAGVRPQKLHIICGIEGGQNTILEVLLDLHFREIQHVVKVSRTIINCPLKWHIEISRMVIVWKNMFPYGTYTRLRILSIPIICLLMYTFAFDITGTLPDFSHGAHNAPF